MIKQLLLASLVLFFGNHIHAATQSEANWGIEKSRYLRQRRVALIDNARTYINSHQFGVAQFSRQAVFSQLREHLDAQLISNIETFDEQCAVLDNDEVQAARESIRQKILSDIKMLEKSWKLI